MFAAPVIVLYAGQSWKLKRSDFNRLDRIAVRSIPLSG
jgi:hypothetical protein